MFENSSYQLYCYSYDSTSIKSDLKQFIDISNDFKTYELIFFIQLIVKICTKTKPMTKSKIKCRKSQIKFI